MAVAKDQQNSFYNYSFYFRLSLPIVILSESLHTLKAGRRYFKVEKLGKESSQNPCAS